MNYSSFPFHAFPSTARNAVEEILGNMQVPTALAANLVLASMAASTQGLANVELFAGSQSPLSLYVGTIAASGERKSAVEDLLIKPFLQLENVLTEKLETKLVEAKARHKAWQKKLQQAERELQAAMADDEDYSGLSLELSSLKQQEPELPKVIRLYLKDVTLAALKATLAKDWPTVLLSYDEAADFLGKQLPEAMGTLNSTWSGKPIKVKRYHHEFNSDEPRITLMWQVQPAAFERFKDKHGTRARDEGLFSRSLIAFPESTQGRRFSYCQIQSWQAVERLNERVYSLLQESVTSEGQPATKICLTFTGEAHTDLLRIRNQVEQALQPGGYLANFKDFGSKLPEQVGRLAAIFHIFEGQTGSISADLVYRAWQVMTWYTKEHIRLFTVEPEDHRNARLMFEFLQAHLDAGGHYQLNKADLLKHPALPIKTKQAKELALWQLIQNECVYEQPHQGRQPAIVTLVLNAFRRSGNLATLAMPNTALPQF